MTATVRRLGAAQAGPGQPATLFAAFGHLCAEMVGHSLFTLLAWDPAGNDVERLSDRLLELRESETRFQGLIDALGDIVVHRDRAGRITYANRVLADLCGCEATLLVGRRLEEFGIAAGAVPEAVFSAEGRPSTVDVASVRMAVSSAPPSRS